MKDGSTVPGTWESLKVVRLTRFLQGRFVVNPHWLNLFNDERSPLKSVAGKAGDDCGPRYRFSVPSGVGWGGVGKLPYEIWHDIRSSLDGE